MKKEKKRRLLKAKYRDVMILLNNATKSIFAWPLVFYSH